MASVAQLAEDPGGSKKAAKKVAKKAAKKAPEDRLKQDTRRCYEHFGRVSALLPLLDDKDSVTRMATLAQELLRGGNPKDAADVLRAAEHLSFGSLAMTAPEESISETVSGALQEEYNHLLERAEHHEGEGQLSGPVSRLFSTMRMQAKSALRAKRYRAAVELARGAEALSHVTAEITGRLRAGDMRRLEMSGQSS